MRTKLYLTSVILFALMLSSFTVMAQDIQGFWGITEVKVGDELMTPVAKWTKINADKTFQMGNGWQQNSVGTWTYDKKSRAYQPRETYGTGLEDEAGPFTVSFKDDKMIWEREEEGMKVVVTLQRIKQLPMSPADQFVGLWDLTQVSKNGQVVTPAFDPENKHYIFIRSDRVFLERTAENERKYGLWHINGHKPEIKFIRNDKDKVDEGWRISINGSELTMIGISDTNKDVEMVYNRMQKFPE